MPHPYAFLAAGVIGAAIALFMYFKNDGHPTRPHRPHRPNRSEHGTEPSNPPADISRPRFFDGDTNCMICCESLCSVKFLPCQHSCMCEECSDMFMKYDNKCPLCRNTIKQRTSI